MIAANQNVDEVGTIAITLPQNPRALPSPPLDLATGHTLLSDLPVGPAGHKNAH